jgi:hypothetical protein
MEMREFLWLCEAAGVRLARLSRDRYRRLLKPEVVAVIKAKRMRKNGGVWSERKRKAFERRK